MKVALVSPYAWDRPGGVQIHVRQLAAALRSRGHDALILAPAGGGLDPEPGVRVIGRSVSIRYNRSVAPISLDPRSVGRVRAALAAFDPDVTHVHEPFVPLVGLAASMASRAPVVGTFHAYAERSRALALAAPGLRPVWRHVAVRLAVSEAAAAFARRHFRGEVRIVPNGVDVERFAAARPATDLPAGRRLLFGSRLDPRKGFPVAVEAFGMLAPAFPDLHLVVIGDGPERGAVEALPAQVRRRVVMLGGVSHQRLPAYYAAADVAVAPGLGGESFGLVLVEALAATLPVVASDIPGYREVVRDGVDGILVRPNDAAALAEGVRRVLEDADLAGRLAAAAPARAGRFRWEAIAADIEAAYGDALAAAGPRGAR